MELFGIVPAPGAVTSGVVVAGAGVEPGGGMVFTGGEVGVVIAPGAGGVLEKPGAGGAMPVEVVAPVLTPAELALGVVTGFSGEAPLADGGRMLGDGPVGLVVIGAGPAAEAPGACCAAAGAAAPAIRPMAIAVDAIARKPAAFLPHVSEPWGAPGPEDRP